MKLGNPPLSISRLGSAEDAAGGALSVLAYRSHCAFRTIIFPLRAHCYSTEKFALSFRGGKKANLKVCCLRPWTSRRAPAGERAASGLDPSLWCGKNRHQVWKRNLSPLGSSEWRKTCFSMGPTENKFQRNRMKRLTAVSCSPGVGT